MRQFTLGTNSRKHRCPQCGKQSLKVHLYIDTNQPVDETRFGRCERVNSCGYYLDPISDPTAIRKDVVSKPDPQTIFLMPTTDQIRAVVNYEATSYLHKFLKNYGYCDDEIIVD